MSRKLAVAFDLRKKKWLILMVLHGRLIYTEVGISE